MFTARAYLHCSRKNAALSPLLIVGSPLLSIANGRNPLQNQGGELTTRMNLKQRSLRIGDTILTFDGRQDDNR